MSVSKTNTKLIRRTYMAAVVRDLQVVYAGRCACGGARRGAAAAVMMNRDKQSTNNQEAAATAATVSDDQPRVLLKDLFG